MSGVIRSVASIAVSVVGGVLGGPKGFALANLAFGLIFPQKGPKNKGGGGQKLEVNTSEYDGPIMQFYGTIGNVGGNIVNVGKGKDGKPAGVLVRKKKKKVGGKGGGKQTVTEERFYLVAEYAIGAAGDGGPLFIDKITLEDVDGVEVLFDRQDAFGENWKTPPSGVVNNVGSRKLKYTPERINGVLVSELFEEKSGTGVQLFLGTELQQPPAFMEQFWGVGNVCPHRGVAKVAFNRLRVHSHPTFTFVVRCGLTDRRQIIKKRLLDCGIPPERLKLQQIDGDVEGAAVGREPAREFCEKLASVVRCGFTFNNARIEDYSKLNPQVWVLTDRDLAAREGGEARASEAAGQRVVHNRTPFRMKAQEEFLSEVSAEFYDIDHGYEQNSAIAPRLSAQHSNPESYDLPEAMRLGDALAWARMTLDEDWAADRSLSVSLLPGHAQMKTGDVMRVPHRTTDNNLTALDYMITEQHVHPSGLLTFTGVPWGSGTFEQGGIVSESDWPETEITPVGQLYYQIFDCAPLHDSHTQRPGFYVIATWPEDVQGVVFAPVVTGNGFIYGYSSAEGSTGELPTRGTFGVAEAALPPFEGDASSEWDNSSLIIKLRDIDGVESESDEVIERGYQNLLRVGDEIIQFVHAIYLGEENDGEGGVWQRYEISRFKRARRATEWAMSGHSAGEQVTLLDNALLRVDLAEWALGEEAQYQFLYEDEIVPATYTCNGVSLKPFSVRDVVLNREGDDWEISFVPRSRFMGWEVNPAMQSLTAPPDSDRYSIVLLDEQDEFVREIIAEGQHYVSAVYPAADQVEDFGIAQESIHVQIARLSDIETPVAPRGTGYTVEKHAEADGPPLSGELVFYNNGPRDDDFWLRGTNGKTVRMEWSAPVNHVRNVVLKGLSTDVKTSISYQKRAQHTITFTGDLADVTKLVMWESYTTKIEGLTNLPELKEFRMDGRHPNLAEVESIAGLTKLTSLDLSNLALPQTNLQTLVDEAYAMRGALGGNSCVLRFNNNPGSSATASSRATEITALRNAGCTVHI